MSTIDKAEANGSANANANANATTAPFAIGKTTKIGRIFADALGDTDRVVVPMDQVENLVKKVQALQIEGMSTIPVAYAGGSFAALKSSGATHCIVGFLAKRYGKANSYICLVAVPFFSTEDILGAGEIGSQWLEKTVEAKFAAMGWNPLRGIESTADIPAASQLIPINLMEYLVTSNRSIPGMDLLQKLWPMVRELIAEEHPDIAVHLPKYNKTNIETVSKALRSKAWAEEHTPELEQYGIWEYLVIPSLTKDEMIDRLNSLLQQQAEQDATDDDGNVGEVGDYETYTADAIKDWAANRETTVIEATRTVEPKDFSALAAFQASFG